MYIFEKSLIKKLLRIAILFQLFLKIQYLLMKNYFQNKEGKKNIIVIAKNLFQKRSL